MRHSSGILPTHTKRVFTLDSRPGFDFAAGAIFPIMLANPDTGDNSPLAVSGFVKTAR